MVVTVSDATVVVDPHAADALHHPVAALVITLLAKMIDEIATAITTVTVVTRVIALAVPTLGTYTSPLALVLPDPQSNED